MTINNKTTKVKEITEASASVRLLLATAVSVVKWPVKRFSDQKCSDKNVISTEKNTFISLVSICSFTTSINKIIYNVQTLPQL